MLTVFCGGDRGTRPCERCELQVQRGVVLGSLDAEDALTSSVLSVAHANNHYYVIDWNDRGRIRRYNREGGFVGFIGRRGKGPGEYDSPVDVLTAGANAITIVDPRNQRLTVISDSNGEVIETRPLPPFATVGSVRALPDGRLLLAGVNYADRSVGLPLHILRATGEFERSLGADPVIIGSWDSGAFRRFISIGPNGSVFAARRDDYLIEEWDTTGALVRSINRHVEWFPRLDQPVVVATSPDEAPTPRIAGVWADERGLLWVFVNVPRATWAEELVPVPPRPGLRPFSFKTTPEAMYTARVEVIDPATDELVATGEIPVGVTAVLANGEAYTSILESGHPRAVVWRFTLQ